MYLANLPCENPSIPLPKDDDWHGRGLISSQSESSFSQFPGEGWLRVIISCESGFGWPRRMRPRRIPRESCVVSIYRSLLCKSHDWSVILTWLYVCANYLVSMSSDVSRRFLSGLSISCPDEKWWWMIRIPRSPTRHTLWERRAHTSQETRLWS